MGIWIFCANNNDFRCRFASWQRTIRHIHSYYAAPTDLWNMQQNSWRCSVLLKVHKGFFSSKYFSFMVYFSLKVLRAYFKHVKLMWRERMR
jgi:hypothetical protein